MNRVQRTLLLAVVVASASGALATYTLLHERQGDLERQTREEEKKRLFSFGRSDVESGVIFARNATIAFARERGETRAWRITSPVRAPANAAAIDKAIDSMASIRRETVITDAATPSEIEEYGLARPTVSIEVTTKKGNFALFVGPKNEMTSGYVIADGAKQRIGIATGEFFWTLNRDLSAFRERRVFPLAEESIVRVRVHKDGAQIYELSRSKARSETPSGSETGPGSSARMEWMLRGKDERSLPADDGLTRLFVTYLTRHVNVETFLTDGYDSGNESERRRYGLDAPRFAVEIEIATATSTQVATALISELRETAGRTTPILHVQGTPTLVEISPTVTRELDKDGDFFRAAAH